MRSYVLVGVPLALFLCLVCLPAAGQDIAFEPTAGPYGGYYNFVSADGHGAVGTIGITHSASIDGGHTWKAFDGLRFYAGAQPELSALLVLSDGDMLAGHRTTCDRDGCGPAGLYHLDYDSGEWSQTSLSEYDVISLARGGSDTLYAVAGRGPDRKPFRLYHSFDRGQTWQRTGPENDSEHVALSPSGARFLQTDTHRVLRAAAGSDQWREVLAPPAEESNWEFDLAARGDRVVLATYSVNDGGEAQAFFYRSEDDGVTWHSVENIPPGAATDLIVQHDSFFVAIDGGGPFGGRGIHASADGVTWNVVSQAGTLLLASDLAAGSNGTIWAATESRGLQKGTATDWSTAPLYRAQARAFSESYDGYIFASVSGHVVRSDDGGLNWTYVSPGNIGASAFARSPDGGTLYVASVSGRVYATQDAGRTWQAGPFVPYRYGDDRYAGLVDLAVGPGGDLFARLYTDGVIRSEDGGQSWSFVDALGQTEGILATDAQGSLYVTAYPCLLYRSDDGATWQLTAGDSLSEGPIGIDQFVGSPSGDLFAVGKFCGSDDQPRYHVVVRSRDRGATWTRVFPFGSLYGSVHLQADDATGLLYVVFLTGTNDGGETEVYRSADAGDTWDLLAEGLPNEVVPTSTLTGDGRLLLNFADPRPKGGVYRSLSPVTDLSTVMPVEEDPTEEPAGEPDKLILHGNHPNPFRTATTIVVSLPEAEEVILTVYDVLGREVHRQYAGRLGAGQQNVHFESNGLPAGAYHYRVQAGPLVAAGTLLLVR